MQGMFTRMVQTGYFPYMAEAEGHDELISTRTAKINAAIKDFKKVIDQGINPNVYKHEILSAHGLSENLLTEAECNKIMREVERYANGR